MSANDGIFIFKRHDNCYAVRYLVNFYPKNYTFDELHNFFSRNKNECEIFEKNDSALQFAKMQLHQLRLNGMVCELGIVFV